MLLALIFRCCCSPSEIKRKTGKRQEDINEEKLMESRMILHVPSVYLGWRQDERCKILKAHDQARDLRLLSETTKLEAD